MCKDPRKGQSHVVGSTGAGGGGGVEHKPHSGGHAAHQVKDERSDQPRKGAAGVHAERLRHRGPHTSVPGLRGKPTVPGTSRQGACPVRSFCHWVRWTDGIPGPRDSCVSGQDLQLSPWCAHTLPSALRSP